MRTRKLLAVQALMFGGALAVAGCSSQGTVDRDELESGVKSKLEAAAHAKAKSVTCPHKLSTKVDATTRCTLQAMDGTTIGVTVTVTSVAGNRVTYQAQADQTPAK
jgi:uncharacterized protein DUF4333